MLKRPSKVALAQIAFGVFLVVFAGMSVGLIPKTGQVCDYDAQGNQENCATYNIILSSLYYLGHLLDVHSGAITAITAIVIVWFTRTLKNASVEQGRQTERSLEIAKHSLTIDQWPYLYVTDAKFFTPYGPAYSTGISFTCKIEHYGKSPAIIRAYRERLIFSHDVQVTWPSDGGWARSGAQITSGEHFVGFANWRGDSVPERWRVAQYLTEGRKYFAVFGIVYDDLFGNQHEAGFCFSGDIGSDVGIRAGSAEHNYCRPRQTHERI